MSSVVDKAHMRPYLDLAFTPEAARPAPPPLISPSDEEHVPPATLSESLIDSTQNSEPITTPKPSLPPYKSIRMMDNATKYSYFMHFLRYYSSIELQDLFKTTALHLAILNHDEERMPELLPHADINFRDNWKKNLLDLAVEKDNLKLLCQLMTVHNASIQYDVGICSYLLSKQQEDFDFPDQRNGLLIQLFQHALEEHIYDPNFAEILEKLIAHDLFPVLDYLLSTRSYIKNLPYALLLAIFYDHEEAITIFLPHADINFRDPDGNNALAIAAERDNFNLLCKIISTHRRTIIFDADACCYLLSKRQDTVNLTEHAKGDHEKVCDDAIKRLMRAIKDRNLPDDLDFDPVLEAIFRYDHVEALQDFISSIRSPCPELFHYLFTYPSPSIYAHFFEAFKLDRTSVPIKLNKEHEEEIDYASIVSNWINTLPEELHQQLIAEKRSLIEIPMLLGLSRNDALCVSEKMSPKEKWDSYQWTEHYGSWTFLTLRELFGSRFVIAASSNEPWAVEEARKLIRERIKKKFLDKPILLSAFTTACKCGNLNMVELFYPHTREIIPFESLFTELTVIHRQSDPAKQKNIDEVIRYLVRMSPSESI